LRGTVGFLIAKAPYRDTVAGHYLLRHIRGRNVSSEPPVLVAKCLSGTLAIEREVKLVRGQFKKLLDVIGDCGRGINLLNVGIRVHHYDGTTFRNNLRCSRSSMPYSSAVAGGVWE
jgi:hypothetical protein